MSLIQQLKTVGSQTLVEPLLGRVDLYNKYRPQDFDDVIGQDAVVRALKQKAEAGTLARFTLFSSTRPGTGKNTLARIIAKYILQIEGDPIRDPYRQYEEYSCAVSGKAEDIREIIERATDQPPLQRPSGPAIKVLMLDELHKASPTALSALLQVTENVPEWLYIIAATTDLAKVRKGKDSGPLVSRAEVYELQNISQAGLLQLLARVCRLEGISSTTEAVLSVITTQANGSAREALTMLSKVNGVTEADALKLLNRIEAEAEFQLQQLINTLLFGWYIPPGGSFDDKVSVTHDGEAYKLILQFLRDNPIKENARLQMIGYLGSMLGVSGERGTPSKSIEKELAKGLSGTTFQRAFGLMSLLVSPEVSYYGPDGEGQARMLVALVNFLMAK